LATNDLRPEPTPNTAPLSGLRGRVFRLVENATFQKAIMALIVVNAFTLGMETSPTVMALIGPEWLFGPRALNRRSKHSAGARLLTSYLPERDTSANRLFVEHYRKTYREDPDAYAYMGYENALAVLLTAADLNGQTYDGAAFIAAMKKVSYFGLMPRGEFALNDTNSAFLKRLFWVEAVKVKSGNRLKQLSVLPVDPDNSVCKKQTARNRN